MPRRYLRAAPTSCSVFAHQQHPSTWLCLFSRCASSLRAIACPSGMQHQVGASKIDTHKRNILSGFILLRAVLQEDLHKSKVITTSFPNKSISKNTRYLLAHEKASLAYFLSPKGLPCHKHVKPSTVVFRSPTSQ